MQELSLKSGGGRNLGRVRYLIAGKLAKEGIISTVVLVGLGRKQQKSPLWISPKTQDRVILSLFICWPYICDICVKYEHCMIRTAELQKRPLFDSSSHVLPRDNVVNYRSTAQSKDTVLFSVVWGTSLTTSK